MRTDASEETAIVATYAARHDAEIAKSFLADQGIDSFVLADDVHVPLQLTESARLVVMQRQARAAYRALSAARLLDDGAITYGTTEEDNSDEHPESRSAGAASPEMSSRRSIVWATTLTLLIVMVLFFIPWRIDSGGAVMWAPFYRNPVTEATTFRELGSVRVHYESGKVAFDLLALQVVGLLSFGWIIAAVVGSKPERDTV